MEQRTNTGRQRSEPPPLAALSTLAAPVFRTLRRPNAQLILSLAALFILSLPVWYELTLPGYILGLEHGVPPVLLFEMDRCYDDGQIPCRWAPDVLQGYGVPVFNYYGPLPYYVGELIHLGGMDPLETVHALYVIAFLLGALFMFLLAREFWGNLGGLVAAVFFVYAPWQASLVYVQGSLAAHWALAFFPAILWAAYMVIKEGKPSYVLLLSLFTCALMLSHNLLLMMFFPLAAVWAASLLLVTRNWQRLFPLAIAGVGAFSLAAFFILPVLLERDLVHLDRASSEYYDYAAHFPRLKQLFLSRFWGLGDSRPGDADQLSFQIGWLHWALTLGSILIAPLLWRWSRAAFWAGLVCLVFFWASVFLMHPHSDFLWRNLDMLQSQQFPFRFLALAIFTSSFLAGAALVLVKKRPYLQLALSIALIGAVIGFNVEFFDRPSRWGWGQFFGTEWAASVRTDTWSVTQPDYAAAVPPVPAPEKVQVINGDAEITDLRHGSDNLVFAATSTGGARLQASVTDFPHWRVKLDRETIPHDHDNAFAAISFDLPPGSHNVELNLEDTSLRKFANYWSLTAWVLWIAAAGGLVARAAWSAFANLRSRREAPASRTNE